MCRSPREDNGGGVGDWEPTPVIDSFEEHDSAATEELLKRKNTELHELQAFMLSVPRAERKKLKVDIDVLDAQIKKICANHTHSCEVQRTAIALNDSISTGDPDSIAAVLQQFIKMTAGLTSIGEVALFYLISAGEGVVAAISQHSTHGGVIEGAFHALCNLFGGLKTLANGDDLAAKWCCTEVGDMVVEAMGQLLEVRDVQFFGCRLLNIIAVHMNSLSLAAYDDLGLEQTDASIASACFFVSARVAVSKARRAHPQDSGVTQWADCAMRLL